MKLHFMGRFNGDENSLPHGEIYPGSELWDSGENTNVMMNILTSIVLVVDALLFLVFCLNSGIRNFQSFAFILTLLLIVPHEIIHALCFKDDVYMYFWIEKGAAFVTGCEAMSKARFILMSLLPNIIFGFIPLVIYMLHPSLYLLGSMCVLTIGMGVGDYYNVINVIRRVPKHAKIYLHKFSSYWFIPNDTRKK